MARSDQDVTVTPSVLDRLIDLDRVASADPPANRTQSVRQLKASLRRDLEWLLNTRRNPDEAPEAYEHLSVSLYNYGLPDVTSMSVDSPRDRNRLLRLVELTVQTFEPRLASVRVRPIETTTSGSAACASRSRACSASILLQNRYTSIPSCSSTAASIS